MQAEKDTRICKTARQNPCRAVGFCGLFFSQKVLMGMSGSSPVFSTFWITTS